MATEFPKSQTTPFLIPANSECSFAVRGNSVRCLSATAPFQISFNDATETIDFDSALEVTTNDGIFFEKVVLKNPTGAAITGKIFIGNGRMTDSKLNVLGGSIQISNANSNTLRTKVLYQAQSLDKVSVGGVSTSIGISGNSGAIICNIGSDIAWINPHSTAVVGQGIPLYPGEKWEHEFVYAVRAICETKTVLNVVNKISPTWS